MSMRSKPLVRGCRLDLETGKKFDEIVKEQNLTKQQVLESLIKAYLTFHTNLKKKTLDVER